MQIFEFLNNLGSTSKEFPVRPPSLVVCYESCIELKKMHRKKIKMSPEKKTGK